MEHTQHQQQQIKQQHVDVFALETVPIQHPPIVSINSIFQNEILK